MTSPAVKSGDKSPHSIRGHSAADALPFFRVKAAVESVQFAQDADVRGARLSMTAPIGETLRFFQRDARAGAHTGAGAAAPEPGVDVDVDVDVELRLTTDSVTARGVTARALSAGVSGRFPKNVRAKIAGELFATTLAMEAEGNLDEKSAVVAVSTLVTPEHIAEIAKASGVALGEIVKPAGPIALDAVARLDAGWRLATASGNVETGAILAHGVPVDGARAAFALDNAAGTLTFSPAMAVVGDSVGRGSFTTNLRTQDYRFLLKGNLRPAAINRWIGPEWARFWKDFDFRDDVPRGDVDVQGNWGRNNSTRVFISVDAAHLAFNRVEFDRALLTLFFRPDLYDIISLHATRGAGHAKGGFSIATRERVTTTRLNFTAKNIDPAAVAPAIAPDVVEALRAFTFETPSAEIKVAGSVVGAAAGKAGGTGGAPAADTAGGAAGGAARVNLDIEATGGGAFTLGRIPFTGLTTHIVIRDDNVYVKNLATQIAGGRLNATARISGTEDKQRVNFDLTLGGARLGEIVAISKILAAGRANAGAGGDADATEKSKNSKDEDSLEKQLAGGRLDLRLAAEGATADHLSFKGTGGAEVTGANLVTIHVLGALSKALSMAGMGFMTINLNTGKASFSIDGAKLKMTGAELRGTNAIIKLSGDFALDTQHADIMARVYPFSATKNPLKRGIGALLVPVSHATELKFSGPIDAPKWRFSYGVTSLVRAISGKSTGGGASAPAAAAPAALRPVLEPDTEPEPIPIFGQPLRAPPFGGGK